MISFLQAEDGIRDYKVTGVQTCALPIYTPAPPWPRPWRAGAGRRCRRRTWSRAPAASRRRSATCRRRCRSEERRVGTEHTPRSGAETLAEEECAVEYQRGQPTRHKLTSG